MGTKRRNTDKSANGHSEDVHLRFASMANWDLEQAWENRPRTTKRKRVEDTRLPIKTADGKLKKQEVVVAVSEREDSSDDSESEKEESLAVEEHTPKVQQSTKPLRQRVLETKEELAQIAIKLNEDPEENIGQLKRLGELANDESPIIQKLALAAQSAIYKDIIPGYRIRPLTEEEQKAKVSKEVRKQRQFEQSLVGNYQAYVETLAHLVRNARRVNSKDADSLAKISVSCACNLLQHVPHFNFRVELLKILVDVLSTRNVDDTFKKARETMEEVFRNDEDGNISLDAVRLLVKMFKAKDYRIHESVLNILLSLRLLEELQVKGSTERITKANDDSAPLRRKKNEKTFRTKRERKLEREKKAIEKEMREADASVSHEQRDKAQAETLKLVFIAYFKILKEKPPGLMAATLEGLARYAHLINIDFFSDILEALKDLIIASKSQATDPEIGKDRNATRESLLCVVTAFALLQGQGADSLSLDLSFFTTHLYETLFPLAMNPDVEISAKSLRLADPLDPNSSREHKINVRTESEMALRALEEVLFRNKSGSIVHSRLAAFTKRLIVCALHYPERSALASVAMVSRLARRNQSKLEGLFSSEESVGDGVYDIVVDEPELSNPLAATIWETLLLEKHYSPKIAEAAKELPNLFVAKTS